MQNLYMKSPSDNFYFNYLIHKNYPLIQTFPRN